MERLIRNTETKHVIVPESDVQVLFKTFVPVEPVQILERIKGICETGISQARYAKKDSSGQYQTPMETIKMIRHELDLIDVVARMQEALEEKDPNPGNDQ